MTVASRVDTSGSRQRIRVWWENVSSVSNPSHTESLLARCQRGEAAAFRELFMRYRQDVVQIIHRFAAPPAEDIEDLVQEVFLQVYRSIGKFRGQSKFSTWLYRVTVNVVLMHLRAQRSRPKLSEPLPEDLRDTARPPDGQAMTNQMVRAFYRVLDQLPEKKRTVFVLHELQGLSLTEVAKIVGAPTVTVRTRLYYARRQLVELLDDDPVLGPYAELMSRPAQGTKEPAGGTS